MTTSSPLFLLTNDDGADAPGMAALRRAAAPFGESIVAAPSSERSAGSHAVTLRRDIAVEQRGPADAPWGWAIDGTPADCVKIALGHLLGGRRPTLILSGINAGMNAGNSIFYSGTIAAAKEGIFWGVPSVALSMHTFFSQQPLWDTGTEVVRRLMPWILAHPFPPRTVLNINIPNLPFEQLRGVRAGRQGTSLFVDDYHVVSRGAGRMTLRNIGEMLQKSPGPEDADDLVLLAGYVCITPLRMDLTDEDWRRGPGADLERRASSLGIGPA